MSEIIRLDPVEETTGRVEFDITPWISAEGVDWGDAEIEQHVARSTMGAIPVDFDVPPRRVTVPLRLQDRGTVTFEQARRSMQAKVALFQREQGVIARATAGGTVYADVTNASLRLGGDWHQANSDYDVNATLTLECVPDWYGQEVELDPASETTEAEFVGVLQESAADAVIGGDYPARCRIVVTNGTANDQLGILWGLRSRHYDADATAALAFEAEDLTLPGFGGGGSAIATVSGASGGASNNVVQDSSVAIGFAVSSSDILHMELDGVGPLTHRGTYKVLVRAYSTSVTPPRLRLTWNVGDGGARVENRPVRVPGASAFHIVDLGSVHLTAAPTGTHMWQGSIQAAGDAGGENVSLDKVWLVPVDEGYGVLRNGSGEAAIAASLTAQLRTEGMFREGDGGNGAFSPVPRIVGALPRLPVSGMEGRSVEVFVKVSRGDFETIADSAIDDVTVQVFYRPCWLYVPGA